MSYLLRALLTLLQAHETVSTFKELAKVASQEKLLLEECFEHFRVISTLEVIIYNRISLFLTSIIIVSQYYSQLTTEILINMCIFLEQGTFLTNLKSEQHF